MTDQTDNKQQHNKTPIGKQKPADLSKTSSALGKSSSASAPAMAPASTPDSGKTTPAVDTKADSGKPQPDPVLSTSTLAKGSTPIGAKLESEATAGKANAPITDNSKTDTQGS